jgi:hypothetical protein
MLRARSLATAALSLSLLSPWVAGCSGAEPSADRASLSGSAATASPADAADRPEATTRVLAISVDGLNPDAIRRLGTAATPTFHRMLAEGAGTLNARTEFEQTVTLPNHASMMTGRRIDASKGGHGVTWDDDRPGSTVQKAAGHGVASIFSEVHGDGGSTALFSTKEKFSLYRRSWPAGIDRFTVNENQKKLVRIARADLLDGAPRFTLLHVSLPDRYGHEYGGMSDQYVAAVRRTDHQLGTVLRAIDSDADLREGLVVILTSDHGFAPGVRDHSARRNVANYRVPFLVWGPGVAEDDLYDLNPGFRDPGAERPSYAGKQPVRNGDVANLTATLLGLDAVSGSSLDSSQALRVSQ